MVIGRLTTTIAALEIMLRYPMLNKKNQLEANKLQKRLRRNVGNAIADYNMIEQGDRVMVCLSGGKDSYGMLDLSLIHISEPTRPEPISYAVFYLKK